MLPFLRVGLVRLAERGRNRVMLFAQLIRCGIGRIRRCSEHTSGLRRGRGAALFAPRALAWLRSTVRHPVGAWL